METRKVTGSREAHGCLYLAGDGYQAAVIPMEPFGKARPKVTVKGVYYPANYVQSRAALRMLFGTVNVRPPWAVRVTAVRQMPKSWSKKHRAEMDGQWCDVKPDIDNVIGGVLDSLLDEDAAVVVVSGMKVWGKNHSLKVELWTAGTTADEAAISPQEMAFE